MLKQKSKAQSKRDNLLSVIEAEETRRSLSRFVQQAWQFIDPAEYVHGWHIDALAEHLEAVSTGEITRLLINMPPRHMKSSLISVAWPTWDWITHPERQWMFSSYALSLALRDSLKCRRLIESEWYQKQWGRVYRLTDDQKAKSRFENDKGGYRLAVSVGSAATGEGGSILVCDDPHNVIEAESETIRQSTLDWWDTTMSTRLNDARTGAKVIVMQRVHADDLSGHVLGRDEYVHLRLPAEYEATNKCYTSIGWSDPRSTEFELLWPERIDAKSIADAKRSLGSLGYAGQYQQRPVPAGGGTFKKGWIRYFSDEGTHYTLETPEGEKRYQVEKCHKFITIDLAISLKQTADFTVMSTWAVTPERELLLLDRLRERLDNPEQQKQIQLLHQRYHPNYIQIENVAYQLAIIQQLLRLGLPVREYKPVKDKVSRASTASVFYEAGRVYHPKHALWLHEWEDELLMFPMAEHDDQVDTVSMACDAIGGPIMSAEDHIDAIKARVERQQQQPAVTLPQGRAVPFNRFGTR